MSKKEALFDVQERGWIALPERLAAALMARSHRTSRYVPIVKTGIGISS
jgi:hypothetical protein